MKLETVREAYMRAETIYNTACTMEEGPERDRLIDQARALHDTTCAEVNTCGPVFADVAGIYYKSMNRGNVVPDIDHSPYNATPAEVVAIFRENGIKRFTMSSAWTDAMKTAWAAALGVLKTLPAVISLKRLQKRGRPGLNGLTCSRSICS